MVLRSGPNRGACLLGGAFGAIGHEAQMTDFAIALIIDFACS